jgi:phosphohistidine swiveling domain-containing protein
VLFTRDPSAGGLAMVEMVQGTAENLVSGTVRPHTYRFGRISKKPFGKDAAPVDLGPLLAMGDSAERLFSGAQDIEWTYRDGEFYLVQSRDITRPVAGDPDMAAMQNDLARAIDIAKGAAPDQVVFAKNELSEMLPRPTPLSLSLMESLWASGGSVDLAARQLGLTYRVQDGANYLATILGRLYVDKREEQSRALVVGAWTARKLVRTANRIERDLREDFLPHYLEETRLLNAVDFERLLASDLIAEIKRLHERLIFDTHVVVDKINISAGFFLDQARKKLLLDKIDPSTVLGHIPDTVETHAFVEVNAAPLAERHSLLLRHFGHRAVLDYELAEPRYSEDADALVRMASGRRPAAPASAQTAIFLTKGQSLLVDIARRFQTLKEDAKHHSLHDMALLRRSVLALDRRFGLNGLVFWLTFEELFSLSPVTAGQLRAVAIERKQEGVSLARCASPPTVIRPIDLEASSAGDVDDTAENTAVIRGTRVSGSKIVEARAIVLSEEDAETGKPIEQFCDGDIIVAPMVNPAWLPYFSRASGLVSEVGGWLSHPAILARECNVTMIVGTAGIRRIANGDRIRLHLDGQIEIVAAFAITEVA